MPRGVRKTLTDKLADILAAAPMNDGVTALAEVFAFYMKDVDAYKLHEIFGEMGHRAQLIYAENKEAIEAARKKPGPKPKPKALAQIVAREATAPKKVRRTPRGQAGKTIPRRKRRAA